DTLRKGAGVGRGIIEGGVGAAAGGIVEEAVIYAESGSIVLVKPDNLARGVDAVRISAVDARGIVEGGVRATNVDKAEKVGGLIIAGDLARGVDAECPGAGGA